MDQVLFEPTYLNIEYLFARVVFFFQKLFGVSASGTGFSLGGLDNDPAISILKVLFFLLAVFFMLVIFYSLLKMQEIREHEHQHMAHEFHKALGGHGVHSPRSDEQRAAAHAEHATAHDVHDHGHPVLHTAPLPAGVGIETAPEYLPYEPHPEPVSPNTARFNRIRSYIESDNPSDWKIAIIDADSMLEELMASLGYPGANLGDRLRNAAHSFPTARSAGTAHGIRNKIAHDPSFVLTQDEARRTIGLFEEVFDEFQFI